MKLLLTVLLLLVATGCEKTIHEARAPIGVAALSR
jgi:hypothetical protein